MKINPKVPTNRLTVLGYWCIITIVDRRIRGEVMTALTDTFSSNAADLIRLFKWLQGDAFAVKLMMKCYELSNADKINRATVERSLEMMTVEYDQQCRR